MDPQLTSTLQGLGDPNCSVDAQPGHIRYGVLRQGGVYQINLILRNLDVEPTRFVVVPPRSEYVFVEYKPNAVPAGLSLKVSVELRAFLPARIENIVEVKCKAHVIKIPVSARVLTPTDYDRLDAESMMVHGKRILGAHIKLAKPSYALSKLGRKYWIGENEFFTREEQANKGQDGNGPQVPDIIRQKPEIDKGDGISGGEGTDE